MSDNERLWRALGWEQPLTPATRTRWIRGKVQRYSHEMPDYENDDAAAVALLEELALRFPVLNLGVHHCSEQSAPRSRWALADWYSTGEPIGEGHIPREAIVNGALALLCRDES